MKYIGQRVGDKKDPYYYGSGVNIKKAIEKYGKDNFIVEIIEFCETRQELNEREIYWISYHNADKEKAFYNVAKGGSGFSPNQNTYKEDRKRKRIICLNDKRVFNSMASAAKEYNINAEGISRCCKGFASQSGGLDFAYYEDYVNGTAPIFEPSVSTWKKVIRLSDNEVFGSILEASRQTGIDDTSIGLACKGKSKTAGGVRWAYYNDYLQNKIPIVEPHKTTARSVICLDTKETFSSLREASVCKGVSPSMIGKVCSGKTVSAKGLRFAYLDDYLNGTIPTPCVSEKVKRKVICLDTNQVFESMTKAAKEYGISDVAIRLNCLGKSKNAKGYRFVFLEDYLSGNIPIKKSAELRKVMCLNDMTVYDSVSDAHRKMNLSISAITNNCLGKTKTLKGYKFAYYDEYLKECESELNLDTKKVIGGV